MVSEHRAAGAIARAATSRSMRRRMCPTPRRSCLCFHFLKRLWWANLQAVYPTVTIATHVVAQSPRQYNPFQKRLKAFVREFPGLEHGDVEALHRTRVASRRLREALPLLVLDHDTAQNLARRLRKVTRALGPARELDVQALVIEKLQQDGHYPPTALAKVHRAVIHARDASREELAATLPTAKLKRLARKLVRAGKTSESHDGKFNRAGDTGRAWRWALEARLARRAGVARSAIERAGALYVPEHLHAVRIALKKLRYAAELMKETGRPHMTADIAGLKSAQDVLGRLHDLHVLLTSARDVQASLSPPDLTAWRELGLLVRALDNDCRWLHARYRRESAKLLALVDRMAADNRRTKAVRRFAAS
ncbi:MAG: hypothetical protein C5B57_01905 [Blastocatellia bacterium]|nr:MAG: hypothetical protein C5B57_01905 [Blastocatellia bacterium]